MEKIKRIKKKCYDNFFTEIDSEIKAYLLGFIAADGCVSKKDNTIRIGLQYIDVYVLKLIQEYICPENIIKYTDYKPDQRSPKYELYFNSIQIKKDLSRYGIVPNKTFASFNLENIPKKFRKDYIRGYFDGDGCFYVAFDENFSKKGYSLNIRVCVNFTNSTAEILKSIQDELKEQNIDFILEEKISTSNKIYYVLAAYNQEKLLQFGSYIYDNANFFFMRKYLKYKTILLNTEVNFEITKGSKIP